MDELRISALEAFYHAIARLRRKHSKQRHVRHLDVAKCQQDLGRFVDDSVAGQAQLESAKARLISTGYVLPPEWKSARYPEPYIPEPLRYPDAADVYEVIVPAVAVDINSIFQDVEDALLEANCQPAQTPSQPGELHLDPATFAAAKGMYAHLRELALAGNTTVQGWIYPPPENCTSHPTDEPALQEAHVGPFSSAGEYFHYLKHNTQTNTPATIRDHWQSMSDAQRRVICPDDWEKLCTDQKKKSGEFSQNALADIVKKRIQTVESKLTGSAAAK